MFKRILRDWGMAAAVLATTGAASAALVHIEHSLDLHLPPGLVYDIDTDGLATISTRSSHELLSDKRLPVDWSVKSGKHAIPLHAALLGGGHHIVDVNTPPGQPSIPNQISAVPLPGAIWLFGSAVIAFLGISLRRRV